MTGQEITEPSWHTRELGYAAALFGFALTALGVATFQSDPEAWAHASPGAILFFVVFGIFTILTGYRHADAGYLSFARIAQVSGILVLGPLPAAWVNGCASLLFPWVRGGRCRPVRHLRRNCDKPDGISRGAVDAGVVRDWHAGDQPVCAHA
ncbi:hypothetical protein [Chromatocurvus halotolerans]|uniref:hypothetical protein n=1 Tax=Chromatocurvus halotolerans TaxID=1132028 RepID=UPI0013C2C8E2|nr:hypothetical protein [Chromatocurvus halotolerans]